MFYVKNLPNWERAMRLVMGLVLIAIAIVYLGKAAMGYGAGAMGVMAAMSGMMGFCPACALAGRRLKQ
ncbi:MAG: YgaP family membrane protein [Methylocystis sp.]